MSSSSFSLIVLLIFPLVINLCEVSSSRTSSSSAENNSGVPPPGSHTSSSSTSGGTSLLPTHRERPDLISAQFRAVSVPDLDTSEPSMSGMESFSPTAGSHGLDEDHLQMSKYMAASASTYAPSKVRLNRYSQAGFYDPYPTYAGAYNTVPSSYYPYNAYGYRDNNPLLDTYPYYERDRIREIRERAMQASQSAPYASAAPASSSNRDGYGSSLGNLFGRHHHREGYRSTTDHHDSLAMSNDHSEHGHGHGWGPPKEYTSKVNTNAIGLLGLLGLLSLLSNVLMQFTTTTTTTTTAAPMLIRHKRRVASLEEDEGESGEQESKLEKIDRIFTEILPHLTPVAHAKDGLLPLECTFHGVCMTNKLLVDELGAHGRPAGIRISSAIVKLLGKVDPKRSFQSGDKDWTKRYLSYSMKNDFKKTLELAGLHGRNKKDCEKSYPVCSALREREPPSLPFSIRMRDVPHLVSKVSRMTPGGIPMNL